MAVWLVAGSIVCLVFYGWRTGKNIASMAVTFAFLIGCGVLRLSPKQILAHTPLSVLLNVLGSTYFFGFAIENGTLAVLTGKLLYVMRKRPALILPAIFFISFLTALMGAGIAASAFLAPVAFSLAEKMKIRPEAAYAATAGGAAAGSNFMYSGGGIVVLGMIQSSEYGEDAFAITGFSFLVSAAVSLLFFAGVYIRYRGWNVGKAEIEATAPLTRAQKLTLWLTVLAAGVVVIPQLCAEILGNPAMAGLSRYLDVGFVMMCAGCIASVLGLADEKTVLKRRVPWGTLFMLGGVSLLIGTGNEGGMAELLAGLISGQLPRSLVAPVLAAAAGLMSMFSSAISVVVPTLYPMIPALAQTTGVSAPVLYMAVFVAATMTGISPLSTNGSMALGGCREDEERNRLFYRVLPFPFLLLALVVMSCLVLD